MMLLRITVLVMTMLMVMVMPVSGWDDAADDDGVAGDDVAGVNESGPAICGQSARPCHREIICEEKLVSEDATVLTVLWLHARVVTTRCGSYGPVLFFWPTSRLAW